MLAVGFAAVSGAMHVVAAGVAAVMVVADLKQLLVTNLLDPAVPIFQVLALFFGVMAGVHAIAAHHGEESAALLLVKPVLLTISVEGFLVVLKNAASLMGGGGITL